MIELLNHMVFWDWLLLGAILLILELVTGGGFLFWTGLSAGVIALIVWIFPILHWTVQWLGFGVLALIAAYCWHLYLRKHPDKTDQPKLNRRAEQYIGRVITLNEPIVNGMGKINIDDSSWRVHCEDLPAGKKIRIVSIDGVILIAKPHE